MVSLFHTMKRTINLMALRIVSLKTIIKILVLLGFLLSITLFVNVKAQTTTPSDDEVNQIAKQLFCPVCENVPLDECPTAACDQWRELIRQRLSEGWSEQEIKDYFVAQYGDRVLGEPPRQGLNWLLYVLPPLIILVGVLLVIRKLKQPANRSSLEEFETIDPYLQQVKKDLRKMN